MVTNRDGTASIDDERPSESGGKTPTTLVLIVERAGNIRHTLRDTAINKSLVYCGNDHRTILSW